ncbi:MAG: prenyltransferase/squalene oxidase repeat-containing protein [Planctomycetota bacterium]
MTQSFRTGFVAAVAAAALLVASLGTPPARAQEGPKTDRMLPRHMKETHVRSLDKGLEWLKRAQSSDGGFTSTEDGTAYPIAMTALAGMAFLASGSTSSRGAYADQVKKTLRYLMKFQRRNGLITGPSEDNGRPMFGHGFALLFFATLYGMENDADIRTDLADKIRKAIRLTSIGQSDAGGWLYYPGGGDEGSVTITQVQALRACHNAGFVVPEKTLRLAIKYLERCKTSEGGIRYSLSSGDQTQTPITCAAVATLYNAGQYDSKLALTCLTFVREKFKKMKTWDGGGIGGHAYYSHLYASQAFYTAGDEYWAEYFPKFSELLLKQQKDDGSWTGDGVGPVYGTAIATLLLQLPYKFLPIYQR